MVIVGKEHFDVMDKIEPILDALEDPVKHQIVLELLTAHHAWRSGNEKDAHFVIDSMAKHAKQMLHSLFIEDL
jgi:hypothetical protein